jgi:uncharacterized LabA/DUF88 family protein
MQYHRDILLQPLRGWGAKPPDRAASAFLVDGRTMPTPPRAYVYVDGFNLYYGCLKKTPYRWLDIERLCRRLLSRSQVLQIRYYTARISPPPNDPDKANRQDVYLRALYTLPLVDITFGNYSTHTVRRRLATPLSDGTTMVDIIHNEEKGSDVNLATHLVVDAARDRFDVAFVMSNDSDLEEPVRMVKQEFGKNIGIIAPLRDPRQYVTPRLARHADYIMRISKKTLQACQFPPTLSDARGAFHKPPQW